MPSNSPVSPSRRLRFWGKWVFRLAVVALVTWGIYRTLRDAQTEFQASGFALHELRFSWMLLAAALYGIGMLPPALFWKRILEAMGQQPFLGETLRAFYIGHLGKYVPGKALVVVLRTSLIRSPRVNGTVAATSVFVETLTFMAVGAAVAALILLLSYVRLLQEQRLLLLLAVLLACGAGLPTWPPFFRRLVSVLQVRRANADIDQAVAGINLQLMAYGWVTLSLSWCFFGASLWAALRSIPLPAAVASWHDAPLLVAAVALAIVAGFLSLVPAGVLVREFVVVALLEPTYGSLVALTSAAVLRLAWLVAEIAIAIPLYLSTSDAKRAQD